MSERGDGPPGGWDGFAPDAGDRGVALEPAERNVVRFLDCVQDLPTGSRIGQQRQHAQRLLGCEGEVVAGAHRRGSPAPNKVDEIGATDQPAVPIIAVGDQVCLAWSLTRSDDPLDEIAVLLVVGGEAPEVPRSHADISGRVAEREEIVGWARGGDVIIADAHRSGVLAPRQLGVGHPTITVVTDDRDEVSIVCQRRPDLGTIPAVGGRRRSEEADKTLSREFRARLEHVLHVVAPEAQCHGSIALVIDGSTTFIPTRLGADAEARSATGRALGGDEPGTRVWIAANEHVEEVLAVDVASQPQLVCASTQPAAGFVAAVRVIAGNVAVGVRFRAWRARGRRRGRGRDEVFHDAIGDLNERAPYAAQRGDRDPDGSTLRVRGPRRGMLVIRVPRGLK